MLIGKVITRRSINLSKTSAMPSFPYQIPLMFIMICSPSIAVRQAFPFRLSPLVGT